MGGIELTLAARAARQQRMPGDLLDLGTVDDQLVFGDPHGQHLPDVLPGHGILVLTVFDVAFAIDRTINHLRRVVGMARQRNQVRLLFRVQLDRTPLGLPVNAHVGDFRQPTPRRLIEVVQRAELTAIEQVHFHVVERPLHFPLRGRMARPASSWSITVVRGESQKAGVVNRQIRLVTGHHDLHIVVQANGRHAAQMLEGLHVLADCGGEVLTFGEAQVLPPRIRQDITEEIDPPAAFLREVQVVLGIVHLCLHPRRRFKAFDQGPFRLRTQPGHSFFENGVAALKAAGSQFLQHADGGDARIATKQLTHHVFVVVQQALALLLGLGKRRSRRLAVAGSMMACQRPPHPLAADLQIAGDAPCRLAFAVTLHDLVRQFLIHGRCNSCKKSSVNSATLRHSDSNRSKPGRSGSRSRSSKTPRPL